MLKGGAVFHASERSEDMYASIDLVSHTLAQILKRHKDKVQSKRKNEKVRALTRKTEIRLTSQAACNLVIT